MKRLARLAAFFLIIVVTAVTAGAEPITESVRANLFFEKAFTEMLKRRPMFQSRLGIKWDYDQWDDISDRRLSEDLAIVKRQLADLERAIDYRKLDRQARLSHDLFVDQAKRKIASYRFRYHSYPVNQMRGMQSSIPAFLINIHRIDSRDDAEAYIARLEKIPFLFSQLIDKLKSRARKGIIVPKFAFPKVLEDSRNLLVGRPFDQSDRDSTLLADFKKKLAALKLNPAEHAALLARAERALQTAVGPAYEALMAYLVLLEPQASDKVGAWNLPDGAAFYDHALWMRTTTLLSAADIHRLGLTEVARIQQEMRAIMIKVGFSGSLQEFFRHVRDEPRFYFAETDQGREDYLTRATAFIAAMRDRLGQLFKRQPQAELVVKRVEPFRERSTGKAFYQRPAPDGSRPGTYFVNLYRMAEMPSYQMEALAYHEAIPGHHLQLAIATEIDGLPKFRKYARYTAYSEGWGLYAERLPKEIGFYQDPYSDFGRLAMELWRACRLVVDTGIHAQRWTREEAIAYLLENTPNPEPDVIKAVERYIVMPAQATAYKIGMLRILELRQRAQEALGEAFDIREFHEVILGNGPVPLTTLEDLVEAWLERKAPRS